MARQVTSRMSTIKLSNFVNNNKTAFAGKSRQAIMALVDATFPGEKFSDAVVKDILAANEITPARNVSQSEFHKVDRTRKLARILQIVVERLTKDLGTNLLTESESAALTSMIGGKSNDSTI